MIEYDPTLREAADVMGLAFFGDYPIDKNSRWRTGIGVPFIGYFPESDLIDKLKREKLGDAFKLMAAGFCRVCPLNKNSPNYEEIIIGGEPVVCQTLEPCCGATEETFYRSGSADIKCSFRACDNIPSGNREEFAQLIESKAVCLNNNNVRTVPYIPLSQR
jgi:hypothetical protein